mgnify:CR=1 FL=1|jgi:hypothetical protein
MRCFPFASPRLRVRFDQDCRCRIPALKAVGPMPWQWPDGWLAVLARYRRWLKSQRCSRDRAAEIGQPASLTIPNTATAFAGAGTTIAVGAGAPRNRLVGDDPRL